MEIFLNILWLSSDGFIYPGFLQGTNVYTKHLGVYILKSPANVRQQELYAKKGWVQAGMI